MVGSEERVMEYIRTHEASSYFTRQTATPTSEQETGRNED